jgi:hypothetical protein
MGFLNNLFGGSKGGATQSQQSGYSALPSNLKSGFDKLGQQVAQYTDVSNPANIAMFTPMGETAGETQAYNNINRGFTPTAETLGADLSMLQNPFNDYVIGGINNAANSDFSILKQNLNQVGQFGSNRQTLGANDVELQRQNQIGSLLQDQYNTALGQVLNNLVPQRQQDALNQLTAGQSQRALDLQIKQAPIAALGAGTSMIAPFTAGGTGSSFTPASSGGILEGLGNLASGLGTGYQAYQNGSSGKSGGSGGSDIASIAQTAASLAAIFSDATLKHNIEYKTNKNGYNIYEFSYNGSDRRFEGVMAQEVQEIMPEAVIQTPIGLAVNYGMIGIEFREVANGNV